MVCPVKLLIVAIQVVLETIGVGVPHKSDCARENFEKRVNTRIAVNRYSLLKRTYPFNGVEGGFFIEIGFLVRQNMK